jgi:hypothetical protein
MISVVLLAVTINRMWYALPLILSVSLVYASTRHERIQEIFRHAMRTAVWITCFMLVVLVILYVLTFIVT